MNAPSPEDRFLLELKDLNSAEKQLAKALPKMAAATGDQEVKDCLESALAATKEHASRLNHIRKDLGISLAGERCEVAGQVLEEVNASLAAKEATADRDVGLVRATQQIEGHEITGCQTAQGLAAELGLDEAAALLSKTVTEKETAEANLIRLAAIKESDASVSSPE